jgi:hypothetical protein
MKQNWWKEMMDDAVSHLSQNTPERGRQLEDIGGIWMI